MDKHTLEMAAKAAGWHYHKSDSAISPDGYMWHEAEHIDCRRLAKM